MKDQKSALAELKNKKQIEVISLKHQLKLKGGEVVQSAQGKPKVK